MKTRYFKILLVFFTLILISCSTPKRDVDKLLKLMEEFSKAAEKAVKDGELDDKEISELNELSVEIANLENKMSVKKNEKGEKYSHKVEKLLRTSESETILKDFQKSIYKLYKCNGAEKLQ
jgi:phage host-nuclease inhibitor protein Gam